MAIFIPDSIDFGAYMRDTDCTAKVRPASAFSEDLVQQFAIREEAKDPTIASTKLRGHLQFRPCEVTAWTGYNGHRKSMFLGQVALDLCAQNERTLIVSLEMPPVRTLGRMAQQAAAQRYPSPKWVQQFSAWTDGRLWLFDHLGRITPDLCIAVLRYFGEELRGTQVMIDSMMMVCESEEKLDAQKQFITDLVRVAQELRLHVHLVTHCRKPQSGEERPPTKYDLRGSAAISDQVANVVTIWANKAKRDKLQQDPGDAAAGQLFDALVTVEKQRNGTFEGKAGLYFDEQSLRFCDDRFAPVAPYQIGGQA